MDGTVFHFTVQRYEKKSTLARGRAIFLGIGVGIGIGCFRGAHKPYTSRDTGNDRSAQLLENLEILDRYATPERDK